MDDNDNEDGHQGRHPAIEVSLTHSIEQLRHLAYEATPSPEDLFSAQRLLLRTATAVIARKGLSTDTETYRRLGILIPHWKHPAQFESALHLLQDYWRHHGCARSLGRSSTFIKVRVKARNYLRKLAAGEEIEAGIADDEDWLNELDNDFNVDPRKCTLPSATMVRVFRLVNGNLEIPATLFKALAVAGRIRDAFFPDEMSTWEQGPAGHGLGGNRDIDAESDGTYNGTQTDIPSSDAGEDEDSSSDGDSSGDDDDDGGNDAVFVDPYDNEEAPHVENTARQATADFFQQMQVARVGNNNGEGSSNNNNGSGNNNGGGGGGLFGGMDFSVLPEVVRRMFGLGNSPAPAPAVPTAPPPPPVPNFVFCPMPMMMMPMQMQMQMQVNMQMDQTGNHGAMGNAMMDAMQNMMKQMSGKSDSGGFNFNSNRLLTGGNGTRKAKSRSIIEIKSDDEDTQESFGGSSWPRSASSSGTKRSSSSAWSDSSSSSKRFKTFKNESSPGASSSSTPTSSSATSTASPTVKPPRRPLPTSRPPQPPVPSTFASAYDASSTAPSSSHVHIPSYRPSSSPAFSFINSAEKKKETFTEFQQRRLRQAERKREKEAARKKTNVVFK